MALFFGDLITDALVEINATTPGQAPDAGDMALGLTRGNMVLDNWTARSLMQYVTRLDEYTFPGPQNSYTIGPSGADFTADRPTEILAAAIVDTTQNPNVYIHITVVPADIWESYTVLAYQTSVPTQLWYETTFPNGTIHLRGVPNNLSYRLRLQTKQNLGQAAALNTQFVFPPGYYKAFMLSLAEVLCNPFGKTGDIKADVTARARLARADVVSANGEPFYMELDGLKTGKEKPYFNWISGPFLQ